MCDLGRLRAAGASRQLLVAAPTELVDHLLIEGRQVVRLAARHEQRQSDHADECEHDQDEARESVGRVVLRATWQTRAVRWPPDQDIRPRALGCAPVRARRRLTGLAKRQPRGCTAGGVLVERAGSTSGPSAAIGDRRRQQRCATSSSYATQRASDGSCLYLPWRGTPIIRVDRHRWDKLALALLSD